MKTVLSSLVLFPGLVVGQQLLLADNFDAPDTDNLDLSDQTGRRSGAVTEIQVRSSRIQHGIISNQLNFLDNRTGRIRFHSDPDNDNTTPGPWHDWATDPAGSLITGSGGLRVEFDWDAGNNSSNNWVSVNMGISGPGDPEPGFRVNNAETDIGMLFRFNGATELFDNGTNLGAQGSFAPTVGVRHVVMDFLFDSFDDGSPVEVIATVDGTEVYNGGGFSWDNNLGEFYFEIGNLESTLLDNLEISALASVYNIRLSEDTFSSGSPQATLIGNLSAEIGGVPDFSTFTLVAGEGDTDNDKFQLDGSQLQVGDFDFSGGNSIDGQQYTIRVEGSGSETAEKILTLTLRKDDDVDDLPDGWEIRWAGDLTTLSGTTPGQDADQDGLTDAAEFEASLLFPDIDPTTADTDGDDLDDGDEVLPTDPRPQTDPTQPDTDLDGLSDAVESNTGVFVDADDTGTNPTLCDTDGDFAFDGWELDQGSDPSDPDSVPAPVGPVSIVPITDSASSGIDADKTYTHLVSGGQSSFVNDVLFEELSPNFTPLNFLWETGAASMNVVNGVTRDWLPFEAGADPDIEALLGSFTYSSNGAAPGSSQRFTLFDLTPGVTYDLRIYSRMWAADASGRPIDLIFTNGNEVVQPFNAMPQDRSGIVTGTGNNNDAFYLSYRYTAQTTDLVIDATIPDCSLPVSGSFHLYALSNEVATGAPPGQILIASHVFQPDGSLLLDFTGRPETTYQVTKSATLQGDFSPLDLALEATTDAAGKGQATIPASETSDSKEFYRIEE